MKKLFIFPVLLFLLSPFCAFAQQNDQDLGDLDRDAAIKAFEQLSKNTDNALKSTETVAKSADAKIAAIAPVDIPDATGSGIVTGCNAAIRVWFELSDGRYVNPRTYRWAPNEVFYIHVQSAVPVYVTIFQNFDRGIPSKRVYPTAQFPNTYRIHMPGHGTKLPVAFKMDGNFQPENMSMVVTRADWEGTRSELPQASSVAVAVAQAGGNETAIAAAYAGVVKGSADLNNETALAKFSAINEAGNQNRDYSYGETKCLVRYRVSYPRYVRPAYYVRYQNNRYNYVQVTNVTNVNYVNYRACYHHIDDVAFYMFSDNGVGQWQVTLQKCPQNWRWNW